MRRAVELLIGGLFVVACSSTVDGRAGTDASVITRDGPAVGGPGDSGPATNGPGSTPSTGTPPSTAVSTTSVTSSQPATETPESPGPTAPELPPGFYGADTDLGYRPMSTDEFDCTPDQASGCFGIMVFAADGCPTGATVRVGIFDKAVDPANPIGTATGVTPAIAAGGSQPVVIADSTGVAGQLTARVQSVTC